VSLTCYSRSPLASLLRSQKKTTETCKEPNVASRKPYLSQGADDSAALSWRTKVPRPGIASTLSGNGAVVVADATFHVGAHTVLLLKGITVETSQHLKAAGATSQGRFSSAPKQMRSKVVLQMRVAGKVQHVYSIAAPSDIPQQEITIESPERTPPWISHKTALRTKLRSRSAFCKINGVRSSYSLHRPTIHSMHHSFRSGYVSGHQRCSRWRVWWRQHLRNVEVRVVRRWWLLWPVLSYDRRLRTLRALC